MPFHEGSEAIQQLGTIAAEFRAQMAAMHCIAPRLGDIENVFSANVRLEEDYRPGPGRRPCLYRFLTLPALETCTSFG
jgi:hypothetical protein